MAFGWFKRKRTATVQTPTTRPAEVATPRADGNETRREDPAPPTHASFPPDKIAARAYEIWVRKGRPNGAEAQNWFEAEAELRTEFAANPEPAAPVRKPR